MANATTEIVIYFNKEINPIIQDNNLMTQIKSTLLEPQDAPFFKIRYHIHS